MSISLFYCPEFTLPLYRYRNRHFIGSATLQTNFFKKNLNIRSSVIMMGKTNLEITVIEDDCLAP